MTTRGAILYGMMALLLVIVGIFQSWNVSLAILNLCLISAIMSLGVNIQWGYAGLFNVGIMGFAALGGLATVLTSMPMVSGAWAAGGVGIGLSLAALGLQMTSPQLVALPLKLLLFVAVDGWRLLLESLLRGYV